MQENLPSAVLGIIGTGQLADYFLAGLRHSGDHRRVILSPYSREKAAALAERYQCQVAASDAELAAQSSLILLATRPADTLAALAALETRRDQVIISVVAGLGLAALRPLAAPAEIVRSLPVCSAEVGFGGMPLYPSQPAAKALLSEIGAVIELHDEASFDAMAVTGCAIIWFLQWFAALQDWLVDNGVPQQQARAMALHSAHGASGLALNKPQRDLAQMIESIARPGTYTLAGLENIREQGGFDALHNSCDEILQRFRAASP